MFGVFNFGEDMVNGRGCICDVMSICRFRQCVGYFTIWVNIIILFILGGWFTLVRRDMCRSMELKEMEREREFCIKCFNLLTLQSTDHL